MDWLTFLSNVIGAFAWPAALVVSVVLLRPALLALLPVLRQVKGFGIEASFGRELEEVRLVAEESSALQPATTKSERVANGARQLAEVSPRSAVLESWRDLAEAIESAGPPPDINRHKPSMAAASRRLLEDGIIDDAGFQIVTMLRSLRNRAAHERDFDIRQSDAIEYALLATQMIDQISRAKSAEEAT